MKKFFTKIFIFSGIVVIVLIAGLLLPATPKVSHSILFASLHKDSLLLYEREPRLILVGGSNLSFGINSQMLKDSLQMNPINTSVIGTLGIEYMLKNTQQYIKKGDIIVFVPEYPYFFNQDNQGSVELLRTLFDVGMPKYKLISPIQYCRMLQYVPKLALSRFDLMEYIRVQEDEIYSVNSFNYYGDTYTHWGKERVKFDAWPHINLKDYNPAFIESIIDFCKTAEAKGATVFISFPAEQDLSYYASEDAAKMVAMAFYDSGLKVIGTPERYVFPDSMMFNTPYHLNKQGVDLRTERLIEDLRETLGKSN
ncbi:MAG: hypothetical protein LBR64_09170 [Dysgonamonadaceae bacterium]|nr:hypothetical protein [Dysgonamonadaceae bacterium]